MGVDKSLVAYFPFKYSDNDSVYGIQPSVNTNTILTGDGILIEEPTTNCIYSQWNENNSNPWGRDTSDVTFSVTDKDSCMMGYSVNWSKSSKTATGNCYINGPAKIDQSKTSLSWTFSCYLKRRDGMPVTSVGNVYLYINSVTTGARLNINRTPTSITDIGNGWYRVVRTDTVSEESTVSLAGFSSLDGTTDWLISGWQLEQKPFATSFVNGSRSSNGNITIPTDIGIGDFTIFGEFIPNSNSDSLPNGSYFLNLGSGFRLSTYNQVPYIDGNTIVGESSNNVHIDYNTFPNDRVRYTIKRNGTTFTWRMVNDSGQDITWTKTHANVAIRNITSLSFSGTCGGIHKNLSIYNRALSEEEILQLYLNSNSFYNPNEDVIF